MSYKEYTVKVYNDGTQEWYINGKLHREDGPARCGPEYNAWYIDGNLHREDGPAVEYTNGVKSWYLDGIGLTEEGFNKRVSSCNDDRFWYKNNSYNGKMVEIDGKKYKLEEVG